MTVINGEVVLFAPGATQAAEFLEHRPEPVSKPRNRSKLLSGSRFGRWTIVELSGKLGNQSAYLCRCDCGIERRVRGTALTANRSMSCGCLLNIASLPRVHGGYTGRIRIPTYVSWRHMIQRTTDPNSPKWRYYGAKGIKVCERWRNSFQNFVDDMGQRPKGLTIDRFPNKNGDYEPGNCRWATWKEQAQNRNPMKFGRTGKPVVHPFVAKSSADPDTCECGKDILDPLHQLELPL